MDDFFTRLAKLFAEVFVGDPPPPAVLTGLADRLGALTAVDASTSGDGIERWLATFRSVLTDRVARETLLVRVAQLHLPRLAEAATLAGVITADFDHTDPAAVRPLSFSIDWAQLDRVLSDPGGSALQLLLRRAGGLAEVKALQALILLWIASPAVLVAQEYAHQGFLALPLSENPGVSLDDLVDLVNSPVSVPVPLPRPLDTFAQVQQAFRSGPAAGDRITVQGPDAPNGLAGLAVQVVLATTGALRSARVPLDDDWAVTVEPATPDPLDVTISFDADGLDPAAPRGGSLGVFLRRTPPPGRPALLIGDRDGTHLAIGDIAVGVTLNPAGAGAYAVTVRLAPMRFSVDPGCLRYLDVGIGLPATLTFSSQVVTGFLQGQGLTAGSPGGGSPALGVEFPHHLGLTLGGPGASISVDDLTTRLEATVDVAGGTLRARAVFTLSARAELGPLRLTLQGAGAWFGRWTDGSFGLIAPTGVGVRFSAGPVTGGGQVRRLAGDELGGALQLKIFGVGAFAYGLYRPLPGGGVSFVALIGIRLPYPGIQIGFGFAVSGFGGLIGINREADTDLLRERLVSGAAGDVLFNDDPLRNASKLLGDMAQFFPAADGVFVVGPTLQLNWMRFITLDLGLFIELPGPRKIFVAGSGRMTLGSDAVPLVKLRVDFIGGVDLTRSLIFFDGALVDSTVLGFITITGGIALRIGYGDNPYFLYSVGGFHPSFQPADLELPNLPRAGAGFDLGIVWFKQQTYLAVTSNTLQFGASTEAGVEIGPFDAHGWIRFDALIQFKPFHFVAAIDAGFDIEFEGASFAGVRVQGELSGPGPLTLRARASIRIIIKISKSVSITLNSAPGDPLPVIDNLADHLAAEIGRADNVRVDGTDSRVVLRPTTPPGLLTPVADLVWEQKRVPLELAVTRAEGVSLAGPPRTLRLTTGWPGTGAESDRFALGTFTELSAAEALTNARFSTERSGVRLPGRELVGNGAPDVPHDAPVNLIRIPSRRRRQVALHLTLSAGLSDQLATVAGSPVATERPSITVAAPTYVAATTAATGLTRDLTAGQALQARRLGAAVQPSAAPGDQALLDLSGVR